MTKDDGSETKVSENSWVSVALFRLVLASVIGAFMSVIGAILWASSVNGKLEDNVKASQAAVAEQEKQGKDIASIKTSMDSLALIVHDLQRDLQDQWKLSDTIWWTSEFQRLNPEIKMPILGTMPSLMRVQSDGRK